jgi:sulfate transport system substrate-binding protein
VTRLFKNVGILDTGARGATTTFVQRSIGDVMVAWESEALLALKESNGSRFEIVFPSVSILAEPPVTWVDKVVNKRGTLAVAQAYLEFLYSPEGQEIAAKHHFRPRLESVRAKYSGAFPPVETFTVEQMFGSWQKAHKAHFAEGGVFENIQKARR